jgi:hypothetical protein
MRLPISTWALIAGLAASGVTILSPRVIALPVPLTVLWLGTWAALFTLQAAGWALFRRTNTQRVR